MIYNGCFEKIRDNIFINLQDLKSNYRNKGMKEEIEKKLKKLEIATVTCHISGIIQIKQKYN